MNDIFNTKTYLAIESKIVITGVLIILPFAYLYAFLYNLFTSKDKPKYKL